MGNLAVAELCEEWSVDDPRSLDGKLTAFAFEAHKSGGCEFCNILQKEIESLRWLIDELETRTAKAEDETADLRTKLSKQEYDDGVLREQMLKRFAPLRPAEMATEHEKTVAELENKVMVHCDRIVSLEREREVIHRQNGELRAENERLRNAIVERTHAE